MSWRIHLSHLSFKCNDVSCFDHYTKRKSWFTLTASLQCWTKHTSWQLLTRTKNLIMFASSFLNNFSLLLQLVKAVCSWMHQFLCTSRPGWPADLEKLIEGTAVLGVARPAVTKHWWSGFSLLIDKHRSVVGFFSLSFFGFPMNWLPFKFRVPSISRVRCLFRCERLGEIWNPSRTRLHRHTHTHTQFHTHAPLAKITCFLWSFFFLVAPRDWRQIAVSQIAHYCHRTSTAVHFRAVHSQALIYQASTRQNCGIPMHWLIFMDLEGSVGSLHWLSLKMEVWVLLLGLQGQPQLDSKRLEVYVDNIHSMQANP